MILEGDPHILFCLSHQDLQNELYIHSVALDFFFEPIPIPHSFSLISILVVDEGRVWNQI